MTYLKLARGLALGVACMLASVSGVAAQGNVKHRHTAGSTVAVPKGFPTTLTIQKIGVKAPVEALDLSKKANKDAPLRWGDVAWYSRTARPGDAGRATMFGHLDSYCCPAVFWKLKYLHAGDQVQVNYKTGRPLTFRVQWSNQYLNSKLPTKFIFGGTTERGLVLITCTGVFHKATGYDRKWIVYARLVLPNGKVG